MTDSTWRNFWGNPALRSNPYGSLSTDYKKGYHRGEDIKPPSGDLNVPVLRPGTIVRPEWNEHTGFSIPVQVAPGTFDIYCHMYESDALKSGTVNAGSRIGRMALEAERPGWPWFGAHLHFVISNSPYGALSNHADFDPRPIISATLATPPTTPQPVPQESDDDMFKIVHGANDNHIYLVGASGARVRIASPYHVSLLQRLRKEDSLLTIELDICAGYLAQVA